MIQKTELRQILLQKRKAISKERREEASQLAFLELKNLGRVLSFSPFGSEINLKPLNEYLKKKNLLYLVPYEIEALFEISFDQIDCILVPALGFDREHYRIGYGKGYYDRVLAKAGNVRSIGVGFKEQMVEGLLPKDPWDIPVKEIRLF